MNEKMDKKWIDRLNYKARLEELRQEQKPTLVERNGNTINLIFSKDNLREYKYRDENGNIRFTRLA